jgi:tape measure domain-containing protein
MVATTANITVRARWEGQEVERGLKTADNDLNRLKSTFQRMAPILRGIGALMGVAAGAQAVSQIVGMADAWKGYQNRIRLFTSSAAELKKTQDDLFAISQRTRVSMGSTVDLYQKLSVANKALGLDSRDLNGVLETISQSLIISGGSAESANAAVMQLGQGLASGVLRGEELNSVMEQAPRLAFALAAGMDVPIGKLRELGAAGKITSTQVITALQSQSTTIASEFATIVPTVETSWTTMTDAVGKYISEFDESVRLTERLAAAMANVAKEVSGASGADAGGFVNDTVSAFQSPGGRVAGGAVAGAMIMAPVPIPGARVGGAVAGAGSVLLRQAINELELLFDKTFPSQIDATTGGNIRQAPDFVGPRIGSTPTPDPHVVVGGARFSQGGRGLSAFESGRRGGFTADFAPASTVGFGPGLDQTLGGNGRGTSAQLQLQAREAAVLAENETELLVVRQNLEVAVARQSNMGQAYITVLRDVHKGELQQFQDNEKARAIKIAAQKDDLKATKAAEAAQKLYGERVDATATALKTVSPELALFVNSLASLAKGDYLAAAVQGFQAIFTAFSGWGRDTRDYAEAILKANEAQREHLQTLNDIAIAHGGGAAREVRQLQLDAVSPLLDLFDSIRQTSTSSFVEDLGAFIKQAQDIGGGPSAGRRDVGAFRLFDSVEGGLGKLLAGIEVAFGPGTSLEDAIRNMFSIEDAFRNLSVAASDLASPLDRAITATYDVREMALRRQAQTALNAAGGDVVAQAAVMADLQRSIDLLLNEERAARAHGGSAAAGASVVTPVEPVVVGPVADLDASTIIDPSLVTPVDITWPTVVAMVRDDEGRHVPGHWSWLVDIPVDLEKIQRTWPESVEMTRRGPSGFLADGHEPRGWGDIIFLPTDLPTLERSWPEAVSMMGMFHPEASKQHEPRGWSDIAFLPDALATIERSWVDAVSMMGLGHPGAKPRHEPAGWAQVVLVPHGLSTIDKTWTDAISVGALSDTGFRETHSPEHWNQVVSIPSDLPTISRPWATAVSMGGDLDPGIDGRHSPTHWNQLVAIPSAIGTIDRPWSAAVAMGGNERHRLTSWDDLLVVDVPADDRITIDLGDVIRLEGSPKKIGIGDLVDLDDLDAVIGNAWTRVSRDRGFNPNDFLGGQ